MDTNTTNTAGPAVTPTAAPVKPITPTAAPVKPAEPTTPAVKPITPTAAPVKPAEPTAAPVKPAEPTAAPVKPAEPTTPVVKPAEPTPAPVKPITPTAAPVKPAEPTATPVKPAEPTAKPTTLMSEDIKKVIVDPTLTGKEKLTKIANQAITAHASVASKMLGYNQFMYKNPAMVPQTGAAKQYDLLNTIKSVVNTENYSEFKTKFDIVNLAFRELKDEAFYTANLYRFDNYWTYGERDLTSFQHILLILTSLANAQTRQQNIKKIDMSRALSPDDTTFTPTAVSNINKYYGI